MTAIIVQRVVGEDDVWKGTLIAKILRKLLAAINESYRECEKWVGKVSLQN